MKARRLILSLLLFHVPGVALALDKDFYTYNTFNETLDAFKRMALIFNDATYNGLFITVSVLGILVGGLVTYTRGMSGQKINPLAYLAPIMIGATLYTAFILPKGNVIVLDKTVNATQTVGGVPDGLVLTMWLLNRIEYIFVNVLDTSSANVWDKYQNHAGGIAYALLGTASSMYKDTADSYLTKSIKRYTQDCATIPLSTGAVSVNEIRRATDAIVTTLAKFTAKATSTVYYSADTAAERAGVLKSCEDAWTGISGKLAGTTAIEPIAKQACLASGFEVNHAVYGANQFNVCKSLLAKAGELQGNPSGTWDGMTKNLFLAQAVLEAIKDGNVDLGTSALANRNANVQALGAGQAITEWMPRIRGFMLTVILALIPITIIFLLTPLATKALATTIGFIVWYTTWSVIDAAMHQSAMDSAYRLFEQISSYKAGLDSYALLPETAAQAYSIFGTARLAAFSLAGMITAALFKLNVGSSLSGIASRGMEKIRGTAEQAAMQTGTMEGQGSLARSSMESGATLSNYGKHGFSAMMRSREYTESMSISNSMAQMAWGQSQGYDLHQTAGAQGHVQAGQQTGNTHAMSALAKEYNKPLAEMAHQVATYDALRSNWGTIGYKQAIERINPAARDNPQIFGEEVFKETYYNNFDNLSRARGVGEAVDKVVDLAYQKTGNWDAAVTAGNIAYQRFQHSGPLAKVLAHGGDGEQALAVDAFNIKQTANETIGKKNALGEQATEIQQNVGKFRALKEIGIDAAVQNNPTSDIAKGQYHQITKEAEEARQTERIAERNYGGNVNTLFGKQSEYRLEGEQAEVARANMIANKFFHGDLEQERNARAEGGGHQIPAANILEAARLDPKFDSLLMSQQKDILAQQSNVEAHLTYDPTNGEFSNVRLFAGSEMIESHSSSRNLQNEVRAGMNADANSLNHLLNSSNAEDRSALRTHLAAAWDANASEGRLINLANDWAKALETKGEFSAAEYRAGVIDAGASVEFGGGIGRALEALGVKVDLKGGATGSVQYSDTANYNLLQTHLEEKLHEYDKAARSHAKEHATTDDEMRAIYSGVMADRMAIHHRKLYEAMNGEAIDSKTNNPMNSITEKAEEPASRKGVITRE